MLIQTYNSSAKKKKKKIVTIYSFSYRSKLVWLFFYTVKKLKNIRQPAFAFFFVFFNLLFKFIQRKVDRTEKSPKK